MRPEPTRPAPVVSIVLPTYNRAPLLGRAIASVLAQSFAAFELLVVDDGSTDDTAAQLARVADPRVRTLRLSANRGAAAARNAGIRASHAPFLAFQDSDDEWLPDKLARHMAAFAACGDAVGLVYSDMLRVRRDGSRHYHHSPAVEGGQLLNPQTRFYQVCSLGIQATVIRRRCLAAVGGFDEAFPALEDLELFIRLSRHTRFHHLREALVHYHETDGLSQNVPAKATARALLLDRYAEDLARQDPDFAAREAAWLARATRARPVATERA